MRQPQPFARRIGYGQVGQQQLVQPGGEQFPQPRGHGGFIAHHQYDHTSILRLIEWRWGLAPLSARDQAANNLAQVLDFGAEKNLDAPVYDVPAGPFGDRCTGAGDGGLG